MPHFRFRAVEPEVVQQVSKTLIDELHLIMNSPRQDFTFEHIPTTYFHEGKPSNGYPFIEVLWFDRGQETQNLVAQIITQQVKTITETSADIAVVFSHLPCNAYYDNAKHY